MNTPKDIFPPGSYWHYRHRPGDVYRVIEWDTNGKGYAECRVVWVQCIEPKSMKRRGYETWCTLGGIAGDTKLTEAEIVDLVLGSE